METLTCIYLCTDPQSDLCLACNIPLCKIYFDIQIALFKLKRRAEMRPTMYKSASALCIRFFFLEKGDQLSVKILYFLR